MLGSHYNTLRKFYIIMIEYQFQQYKYWFTLLLLLMTYSYVQFISFRKRATNVSETNATLTLRDVE